MSTGVAILKLDGPCTIRNATVLHKELLDFIGENESISLDIAGDADFDASFVQLIESARRYATGRGKSLTLNHPASGRLLDVLQRVGLVDASKSATSDFWLNGGDLR
ncbi:STAS domain-containing protein [Rhizobium cremeum]|uniref:STAS domain-containing protein n=1 Tax=Rhizobium cremeum TaxID=2813827 RepID=UPI000DDCB921|nr:STAS domain-containing protein [Rhizobium cremeum]MCJ7997820.1 STAS domain-containing protein [Rhizobium cremeum]MCJ8001949.1 STAS domain-containing protein [Rhizobium cremeum]MCJ8002942.1 STAS domain-containing protein [Rhizobium cremeum]